MKVGTRHLLLKLIDKETAQYETAFSSTNTYIAFNVGRRDENGKSGNDVVPSM